MPIRKTALYIFLFTVSMYNSTSNIHAQDLILFSQGIAKYSIYISGNSTQEQQAAKILQRYLQKISGAVFNISTQKNNGANIIVLTKANAQKLYSNINLSELGNDGVVIKSDGENLLISGDEKGGLKNAVYEFLEKFIGCRYFAPDAIYLPQKSTISVAANLNYKYTPPFKYRFTSFYEAYQAEYPAWHKLINNPAKGVAFPPSGWGLWIHSFFSLVPPAKYFKTHPEYYALRNGKRVATQLCLTNRDVLKLVRDTLAVIIKDHPDDIFFSVSQADNNGYCQCDNCTHIANTENSQSGPIIKFVNEVAASFPDKIISTLAYNYSRSAPKNISPAANVNVMICATDVNRGLSFYDDKSLNSVYHDVNDWKTKTSNIFFWDYLVDYRHFFMPFPIYHMLQPNIQFLSSNQIPYTIQQAWNWRPGDMSELKCYLVAQLLWDPNADIDAAQKEFINFYYGPAAKWIAAYINSLTNFMKSHKITLTNSDAPLDHVNDFLSPEQIKVYQQYFDKAEAAVKNEGDTVYRNRINKAAQSLRYAILEVNSKLDTSAKKINYYLNVLDAFKKEADKLQADLLDEGKTKTVDYYYDDKNYLQHRIVPNLAAGATAKIIDPAGYVPKQSLSTLFDGILGNKTRDSKWVSFQNGYIELIIKLSKPVSFKMIKMDFIHDPDFFTLLPQSITYSISDNGKDFSKIGTASNTWTNLGVKAAIKTFQIPLSSPKISRFIKISIKMIDTSSYVIYKKQPVMMSDEIIIQ